MDCVFNYETRACSVCGLELDSANTRRNCSALLGHSRGCGPGTELKKILAGWPLYITTSPDCSCNAKAAEMDFQEQSNPGWCEANLGTIVGWLREQAAARGLPFLDMVGRMLVKRAIRNARRNA
jgi:hypothetical protein